MELKTDLSPSDLKEKGNQCFKTKKYKEACKWYSQAITASHQETKCDPIILAQIYANRSLCNFRQELYQESFSDAIRATEIIPNYEKGFYLAGKALCELGRFKKAREMFGKGLDLARKRNPPNSELQDWQEQFLRAENGYLGDYFRFPLKEMSNTVQVKTTDLRTGKGVFSTKTFHFQDTIFTEKPLVCARILTKGGLISNESTEQNQNSPRRKGDVENEPHSAEYCSYCFRQFLEPTQLGPYRDLFVKVYPHGVPKYLLCEFCHTEKYCSEQCHATAWKDHHRVLCPYNDQNKKQILEKLQQMARSYERTNFLLIAKMMAQSITEFEDDRKNRPDQEPEIKFTLYENFMGNQELANGDEEACRLFQTFFQDDHPLINEKIVTLLNWRLFNGLILRNTQKIVPVSDFHAFAEISFRNNTEDFKHLLKIANANRQAQKRASVQNFLEFLTSEDSFLATLLPHPDGLTGLFLVGNSMNHSCEPNVVVASNFSDFRISVQAFKDVIPMGSELAFSYIDEDQPYPVRQKNLLTYYLFECRCPKCRREQPHYPMVK